ncbi:MAG: peptidoglycan-binding domain-containing protein, partial [Paracoccaceae bacterium]
GFDPALVLAVQARLNQNGINVGKPDGAAGPNTRKGIQKFNQTSLGRDSEKIDIALLTALGMTAADAAPYKLCP